jgi:hypothetical protein
MVIGQHPFVTNEDVESGNFSAANKKSLQYVPIPPNGPSHFLYVIPLSFVAYIKQLMFLGKSCGACLRRMSSHSGNDPGITII